MIRGGDSRRQLFTSRPEKEELEIDEDVANDVPQWEAEFRYAGFFLAKMTSPFSILYSFLKG